MHYIMHCILPSPQTKLAQAPSGILSLAMAMHKDINGNPVEEDDPIRFCHHCQAEMWHLFRDHLIWKCTGCGTGTYPAAPAPPPPCNGESNEGDEASEGHEHDEEEGNDEAPALG